MAHPDGSTMTAPTPGAAERMVRWVFESRRTGEIVVAQWPNIPLVVYLAATLVARFVDPSRQGTLVAVGRGALLVWAADELLRGVNPWRRLLGAVAAVLTLLALWEG